MQTPVINGLITGLIEIWTANVDCTDDEIGKFALLISAEEAARAKRFRFARDRDRFVVRHGILRLLLTAYTGLYPKEIGIKSDLKGKPYIEGGDHDAALQFSMSHSVGMAVFAFGLSVELGVDIERISSFPEMNELAAANFTPAEVMELDCCPESVRVANFYKLWTRKEAVLKACGDGLAIALNRVDVSKPAGEVGQWSVSRIEGDGLKRRFRFMDVAVAPGFAVAVAAANGDQDLSIFTHHYVARID